MARLEGFEPPTLSSGGMELESNKCRVWHRLEGGAPFPLLLNCSENVPKNNARTIGGNTTTNYSGPMRNGLILLSIILVGIVLRFYGIQSVWFGFDENITLGLCQADWFTFHRIMWLREMNMVAYYATVRLWLTLHSEVNVLTYVRCLSALFSVATIPLLYALGKRLFNGNVGLLAAGLLSINAFHIKHAQNARSYSMFVFLVTLATLLLVNNIKNANPRWTAYTCVWVLAVYTHVFAFLFLAAHLIAMTYIGLRPKMAQLACLFGGIAPMALWTASHHSGQPLDWVKPTTVRDVAGLFAMLVGNDGFFLLFIAIAAVLLPMFVSPAKWDGTKLLLVWALAPVTLAVLASLLQPCFAPRFLIPCLPATTLLIAASIERYKPLHAVVLLALIVFGMLMGTQPIGA